MVLPRLDTAGKTEDFIKCGEIITTAKVGKTVYSFSCTFCVPATCLPFFSFENYVLHMEEQHNLEFDENLGLDEEDEELTQLEEDYFLRETNEDTISSEDSQPAQLTEKLAIKMTELPKSEEIQFSDMIKEDSLTFTDPLEERPLSVLSVDFTELSEVKAEDEFPNSSYEDDDMNGNFDCDNDINTDVNERVEESKTDMDKDDQDNEAEVVANERDITLAIIDSYKKYPLLWDANVPNSRNARKRKEALKKIASSVNKQIGVQLNVDNVRERVNRMRIDFRIELKKQNGAKSSDKKKHTPVWYYDKLSFLNATIKYKQRNIIGAKCVDEKPALPIDGLTNAQNIELIDIYKSFPCLWDVQHIGYRFKDQQKDTFEEMLEAIRTKINLEFTQDELQKNINSIRYACTQEKHRKLRSEKAEEDFKPYCKYYENITFLEQHVSPFKCSFCGLIFNGVDKYRVHKFKHDGLMPFTCPVCDHGFMESGNYKVHLRRHARDYPFECKECGKRYATSTDVTVHMRTHTGEKPYCCDVCGRSFRTWTMFSRHMARHQETPSHKCTICMKAFYEKRKLTEHMKGHLNVRDKVCNVCGKAFTSSRYLRQHKQIHAEKKKYVCRICGKHFAQCAGLSGHMKSHGTTMSGTFGDETFNFVQ